MSEEKIDKAIAGAVSNVNVESINPTKEELKMIKEALQTNTHPDSLLYKIVMMFKKHKEENDNSKSK
jgi:hypothetical protein